MRKSITEEEYEAVKRLEKKERNKRISRRLKVIILRYEGMTNAEISSKLDLSSSRVSHLVSEFKTKKIEDYAKESFGGNHRSMSWAEEQEILDKFSKTADAGQVINVQDIKAAFDKKIGKDTGRGYIYMLLKRHGWRKIKPRSEHPKKASDEEIAASKKLTLRWEQ